MAKTWGKVAQLNTSKTITENIEHYFTTYTNMSIYF